MKVIRIAPAGNRTGRLRGQPRRRRRLRLAASGLMRRRRLAHDAQLHPGVQVGGMAELHPGVLVGGGGCRRRAWHRSWRRRARRRLRLRGRRSRTPGARHSLKCRSGAVPPRRGRGRARGPRGRLWRWFRRRRLLCRFSLTTPLLRLDYRGIPLLAHSVHVNRYPLHFRLVCCTYRRNGSIVL